MKYYPIDVRLFINNRDLFVKNMAPNTIAVFNSNDEMPRSADGFHNYRQNSDIFYLTGIDQEQSILVLYPGCPKKGFEEVLFVRKTNEYIATWEGHKYTQSEATETSGITKVLWLEDFAKIFPGMMNLADGCYLNLNEHGRYDSTVPYKDLRFARQIKENYPLHKLYRAAPILSDLRSVKHRYEVEMIEEAIRITNKAFRRVLNFVKPGVYEHEIEAEILHEFIRNRATGPAYGSIVASGKNACVLHYVDNNKECRAGDVILMDFGAEYANYAADLTRSIPVSGRFTERQRKVYDAVLRVMNEATNMLRPGTMLAEYHKEVGKIMESELIGLGLITKEDVKNQNPNMPAYKKYFMHGTSHYLGLDVHDVGSHHKPMQAGNVFTCEPGIYIQEENLGIRLENDVLVTGGDPVNLMADIPVEAEEIEELMNAEVKA